MDFELNDLNIKGITVTRSEQLDQAKFSDNTSKLNFSLNLGAGLEYALDFADLFGEAKLGGLGGDANQFVLGAGLRFPI